MAFEKWILKNYFLNVNMIWKETGTLVKLSFSC